ncbi:MAG: Asp23/Gls24 family envelope stress response protein [Oscillospiraceae bacterium]|nr:Asp23/Gls24 family envelope stress response protein [Oscillospiraceae bacterium]
MNDNKEYISQQQEHGAIHISEDAIVTIAATAASEVEGVVMQNGRKGAPKGVRIAMSDDGEIRIDCYILTKLQCIVLDAAKSVQMAVASAVASVTGLTPTEVNVTVVGVVLPREGKK